VPLISQDSFNATLTITVQAAGGRWWQRCAPFYGT
jgi:hypothetical protein